jgi:ATP-dependent Clp protease ATP-binding subunit ClpA
MFEKFTKPAREAIVRATAHAVDATARQVRPEHILLGILDQDGCLAVGVLSGLGVPPDRVRTALDRHRLRYVDGLDPEDAEALAAIGIDLDEVVRRIDRNLGGPAPTRNRPRFSRPAKKVLELALREALALRHGYIGTEHLLLALVRGGDRVVADTMASCGITAPALRSAVAEAVRRAG